MGKQDLVVNRLLERKEIFADLINGALHGGNTVLREDQLELLSSRSGMIYEDESGEKKLLERIGDIRMKADLGIYTVIFANETQTGVHYAMPVRMMLYTSLEYVKQVQELERHHSRQGDRLTGDAFLSGITREDRICPVVNTVLYLGDDWDGSRSLYEMLDVDWSGKEAQELKQYIPDYPINLIAVRNIENPKVYKTCLQQIFTMLKYNKDKSKLYQYIKEHRKEIRGMDRVEQTAAFVLMGEQKLLEKMMMQSDDDGEGIDVCKAIDDLIEDGEKRGERRGERRGVRRGEKRGEKRMSDLILALIKDGRPHLVEKMASDPALKNQLFRQYGI